MPRSSLLALFLSAATLALLWFLFRQPEAPTTPVSAIAEDYPARDWRTDQYSKLNMSLFTFIDNNRNGRYDLGDRPLASIAVHLTRPDGSVVTTRSNINGFANFGMLFEGEADEADITRADADYRFVVAVPPRWKISTDNAQQVAHFAHLPGSVSGLIAEQPPQVVGLMPQLQVSGRIVAPGDKQVAVSVTGPDGKRQALELSNQNQFSFVGNPGEWLLEATDVESGAARRRSFTVLNAPVQLSLTDLGQTSPASLTFPVLEDFEYLRRSIIDKLPGGRSGLDWDFLLAVDNQYYGGPGYANGLRSGKMVGYNSSGHPVTILPDASGDSFDFVGAYFTVAWPSAEGEQLQVRAWRKGQVVGQEAFTLSYLGPVWFQADYHQIDRLDLASAHYWQFVTDDMKFHLARDPNCVDSDQAHTCSVAR